MNNNETLFKVLVSNQILLEGLDELKENKAFYSGTLKRNVKELTTNSKRYLEPLLDQLWQEDEKTTTTVLNAYDSILDSLIKSSASELVMKATLLQAFDNGEIKYENS